MNTALCNSNEITLQDYLKEALSIEGEDGKHKKFLKKRPKDLMNKDIVV